MKSCTMLAAQADGASITTIEGLADGDEWHPVQTAFHENHGLQCGYCTAGMVMAAVSLLEEIPNPTEHDVRLGLEGNLCRCTGYHNIVKSVLAAAETMQARQVIPAAFDYVRADSAARSDRADRRARRRRQVPRGRHVAAAADEAAARDADGAGRRRPRARPLVRPRRGRPRRDRRAHPPPRPRDQRRARGASAACCARSPRRSATTRCATAARSADRSRTAIPPPTFRPRCSRSTRRSSLQGPGGTRESRRPSSSRASSRPRSRPTSCSPRSGCRKTGAERLRVREVQPAGPGLGDRRRGRGARQRRRRTSGWSTWAPRRCARPRSRRRSAQGASAADAAREAADGTEPPADLNASPEYREHLAQVLVRRALEAI